MRGQMFDVVLGMDSRHYFLEIVYAYIMSIIFPIAYSSCWVFETRDVMYINSFLSRLDSINNMITYLLSASMS